MAVGGVGWDDEEKRARFLLVTHGTLDQITDDFRNTTDLVGYFTVNISDMIRRLRARRLSVSISAVRSFSRPTIHDSIKSCRKSNANAMLVSSGSDELKRNSQPRGRPSERQIRFYSLTTFLLLQSY